MFISLHANASFVPGGRGATIYVAAFGDADGRARTRRARAPADRRRRHTRHRARAVGPRADASRPALGRSGALRRRRAAGARTDRRSPIERAPFRVLESANMPAILIEVGYLTNPEQEKLLTTAEFQTTFAQGGRRSDREVSRLPERPPESADVARSLRSAPWRWSSARCPGCFSTACRTGPRSRAVVPAMTDAGNRGPGRCPHQGAAVLCERQRHEAHVRRAGRALRRHDRRTGEGDRRRPTPPPAEAARVGHPAGTTLRALFVTAKGDAYVDFSPRPRPRIPAARRTSCSPSTPSSTR